MAFTSAQRISIYQYLGYAARFHQVYSFIEYAIGSIETNPDAEALVITYLGELADIDTRLTDAYRRIKADQIGEIKLTGAKEINILRSEGRRLVNRLASIMGVVPVADVYGKSTLRSRGNYLTIA